MREDLKRALQKGGIIRSLGKTPAILSNNAAPSRRAKRYRARGGDAKSSRRSPQNTVPAAIKRNNTRGRMQPRKPSANRRTVKQPSGGGNETVNSTQDDMYSSVQQAISSDALKDSRDKATKAFQLYSESKSKIDTSSELLSSITANQAALTGQSEEIERTLQTEENNMQQHVLGISNGITALEIAQRELDSTQKKSALLIQTAGDTQQDIDAAIAERDLRMGEISSTTEQIALYKGIATAANQTAAVITRLIRQETVSAKRGNDRTYEANIRRRLFTDGVTVFDREKTAGLGRQNLVTQELKLAESIAEYLQVTMNANPKEFSQIYTTIFEQQGNAVRNQMADLNAKTNIRRVAENTLIESEATIQNTIAALEVARNAEELSTQAYYKAVNTIRESKAKLVELEKDVSGILYERDAAKINADSAIPLYDYMTGLIHEQALQDKANNEIALKEEQTKYAEARALCEILLASRDSAMQIDAGIDTLLKDIVVIRDTFFNKQMDLLERRDAAAATLQESTKREEDSNALINRLKESLYEKMASNEFALNLLGNTANQISPLIASVVPLSVTAPPAETGDAEYDYGYQKGLADGILQGEADGATLEPLTQQGGGDPVTPTDTYDTGYLHGYQATYRANYDKAFAAEKNRPPEPEESADPKISPTLRSAKKALKRGRTFRQHGGLLKRIRGRTIVPQHS